MVDNSVLAHKIEYIPDVSRATNGAYIELLWGIKKLLGLPIAPVCI